MKTFHESAAANPTAGRQRWIAAQTTANFVVQLQIWHGGVSGWHTPVRQRVQRRSKRPGMPVAPVSQAYEQPFHGWLPTGPMGTDPGGTEWAVSTGRPPSPRGDRRVLRERARSAHAGAGARGTPLRRRDQPDSPDAGRPPIMTKSVAPSIL